MTQVRAFYTFMHAREQIRLNREAGLPQEAWTSDPILKKFKFTNVKRSHDRTTRMFASLYDDHRQSPPEVQLLNCGIARYFGRWEFLYSLGWQNKFDPDLIISFAREKLSQKTPVFTGAYIITNNGVKAPKEEVVVNTFLRELWEHRSDVIAASYERHRWEDMVGALRKLKGFGGSGFMAKEVALDTMLTSFWNGGHIPDDQPVDANTWSPAGPGARRGLNRLFGRPVKARVRDDTALIEMIELHSLSMYYWPDSWVKINVTDVQFQLCEWDKYERARLGEGRPRNLFRPTVES